MRSRFSLLAQRALLIGAVIVAVAFAVGSFTTDDGTPSAASRGSHAVATSADRVGSGGAGGALSAPQAGGPSDADEAVASAGGPAARAGAVLPDLGDRVVREANLTIEVRTNTFDRAWNKAHDVTRAHGGRILRAHRGEDGDPRPLPADDDDDGAFGDLTMRVPVDEFEEISNELRLLGTVRGDTVSSEDVTTEYVDLESRLRHLRAQETVLLRLMRRARSIDDTITVQSRLADVQQQTEEIRGRLNYLDARTEFSTINLHLAEPGAVFPPKRGGPSIRDAWATALEGLVRMASAGLIAATWAAPFALLIVLWRATRRRGDDVHTPAA